MEASLSAHKGLEDPGEDRALDDGHGEYSARSCMAAVGVPGNVSFSQSISGLPLTCGHQTAVSPGPSFTGYSFLGIPCATCYGQNGSSQVETKVRSAILEAKLCAGKRSY